MVNFCNTAKRIMDQSEDSREMVDMAFLYLCSGNPYAAYVCLENVQEQSLAVLYNRALCLYLVDEHEECYQVLKEAEKFIPNQLQGDKNRKIPRALLEWEHETSPVTCPLPRKAPENLAVIQLLRLKAEAAFHLQLYEEVKRVASVFHGEYKHINELIKKIGNHDL